MAHKRRIKVNTKYTRVVVALFLAVATLATMGFSAPNDRRTASTLADHVVCESIEPSFRALERPDLINDSCYDDLVDAVEIKLGWAFSGQASVEALLESIYASSRSTEDTQYVELLTSEIEISRFIPAAEPSVKITYPELLSSEIEMSRYIAPVRSASVKINVAPVDTAYFDLLASEAGEFGMDGFAVPVESASVKPNAARVDTAYQELLESEAGEFGMDGFATP
jgi:hypothetical protein